MTSATKLASIADRVLVSLADWFDRCSCASPGIGACEVDLIARDLRVSRTELEGLVARGRQRSDELPKMLQAFGIDEQELANRQPGVLRDMTLLCSLCVAKSRCARELRSGTAKRNLHEYCANDFTIEALMKAHDHRRP